MSFNDIKNFTFSSLKKLSKHKIIRAFVVMRNKVEEMEHVQNDLQKTIQGLKDKVRKLKGEPSKPNIKPAQKDTVNDNMKACKEEEEEKKPHKKSSKRDKIKVDRVEEVKMNKRNLPKDAKFKGTRSVIIQDIKVSSDNIRFIIPRYFSKTEGKSYEGEIPSEYRGSEFGPGIWALIKQLHYEGRMTQNLLKKMIEGMGVKISVGQINQVLMSHKGIDFREEMRLGKDAAIKREGYQQIDDTGARVEGKNGSTFAIVNNLVSYFSTSRNKSRISAIRALVGGGELRFCINEKAIEYMGLKIRNKVLVREMGEKVSRRIYTEAEFDKEIMGINCVRGAIAMWRKYIKEGSAIGAMREGAMGIVGSILICDDAPQFKEILDFVGLCWVHEIRHYKKLEPEHVDFKKALGVFFKEWKDFYKDLKRYKEVPNEDRKKEIEERFEYLFTKKTDYFMLDKLKRKTYLRKNSLLLVLKYPWIPLHNNATEQSIREKVVQRNIKHKFKRWFGAETNDLYLSLLGTCRKLNVSFGEYLKDRLYHRNKIPPLAQIIASMP